MLCHVANIQTRPIHNNTHPTHPPNYTLLLESYLSRPKIQLIPIMKKRKEKITPVQCTGMRARSPYTDPIMNKMQGLVRVFEGYYQCSHIGAPCWKRNTRSVFIKQGM